MAVSIRKLRASTKEILSRVGRGDTVYIENHGRRCAKIVPLDDKAVQPKVRSIAGLWENHKKTEDVHAFLNALRAPRHAH